MTGGNPWKTTVLSSKTKALRLFTDLFGKRWLCRGQPKQYRNLVPKIDRDRLKKFTRVQNLRFERQSIELFRSTARFFADLGERGALNDDIATLMVLRHYGVPTRLLDWSVSPYVATYFACSEHETRDGEIWTFDLREYGIKGKQQWRKSPETTIDRSGNNDKFDAKLTAFSIKQPPDWFICAFYPSGFPRQQAQCGAYSMTAQFNRDHADSIARLLGSDLYYHRYIIPSKLKPVLLEILQADFGIWRGSLYPDSAGAADTASKVFPVR